MEEKKYGIWNKHKKRWWRGYLGEHNLIWQEPENPIPLTLEEAQEYASLHEAADVEVRELATGQAPAPSIDLDKLAENIPDYHSLPLAHKKEPVFDFDTYNNTLPGSRRIR